MDYRIPMVPGDVWLNFGDAEIKAREVSGRDGGKPVLVVVYDNGRIIGRCRVREFGPVHWLDEPAVTQDPDDWQAGYDDALAGRPVRRDVGDRLAYASGRVEGEAARLRRHR